MTRLKKKYLKKQKLAGLFMIIVAILVAMVIADGTVGLLVVPVGLWFIFSKKVIFDRYNYIDELKERQRQMRSR